MNKISNIHIFAVFFIENMFFEQKTSFETKKVGLKVHLKVFWHFQKNPWCENFWHFGFLGKSLKEYEFSKWTSIFFIGDLKLEKTWCSRCVQIMFFFQNNLWDGHKCSGFQPFLNRIFPRGDKSIFKKSHENFPHKLGGGDGFEIDQICGFCLKTHSSFQLEDTYKWKNMFTSLAKTSL